MGWLEIGVKVLFLQGRKVRVIIEEIGLGRPDRDPASWEYSVFDKINEYDVMQHVERWS